MIGLSDRLRIVCHALGIEFDELADRLISRRSLSGTPADRFRKEQLSLWWTHKRDPAKAVDELVSVLQDAADKQDKPLDVANLFRGRYTPAELASACDLDILTIPDGVLSNVTQRTVVEALARFPYLDQALQQHRTNLHVVGQSSADLIGTYRVYRLHSSDRALCSEFLTLENGSLSFPLSAIYHQYASGNVQRMIPLSILPSGDLLHAVGAYGEATGDGSPSRFFHALVWNRPYAARHFPGLLLDTADNNEAIVSQRVLIIKVSSKTKSKKPLRARVVSSKLSDNYLRYTCYLFNSASDDHFQLTAMQSRLGRILSADPSSLRRQYGDRLKDVMQRVE